MENVSLSFRTKADAVVWNLEQHHHLDKFRCFIINSTEAYF